MKRRNLPVLQMPFVSIEAMGHPRRVVHALALGAPYPTQAGTWYKYLLYGMNDDK